MRISEVRKLRKFLEDNGEVVSHYQALARVVNDIRAYKDNIVVYGTLAFHYEALGKAGIYEFLTYKAYLERLKAYEECAKKRPVSLKTNKYFDWKQEAVKYNVKSKPR